MAVEQKEMVGTLTQKVNKVIALYTNIKQENNKLHQQQKELKESLKIKETELEFYKNKYNKLKLAKSIVASSRRIARC